MAFSAIRKSKRAYATASTSPMALEGLEGRRLMSTSFELHIWGGLRYLEIKNVGESAALHVTPSADGKQLVVKTSFNQTLYSRPLSTFDVVDFNGTKCPKNKFTVSPAINKRVVFYGGDGPDYFVGGSGPNYAFGFGGADYLYGGRGEDSLHGQEGDDTLAGGSGNDTMYGDDGIDTVTYFDRSLPVTIKPTEEAHAYSGGLAEGERDLVGDDNENFVGGAGNDIIFANPKTGSIIHAGAGNDRIYGSDKNDRLYGEAGRDTIEGGWGSDYLVGGAGSDFLDSRDSVGGNDTIYGGNSPDSFNSAPTLGTDTILFDQGAPRFVTIGGRKVMVGYASDIVNYAVPPVKL